MAVGYGEVPAPRARRAWLPQLPEFRSSRWESRIRKGASPEVGPCFLKIRVGLLPLSTSEPEPDPLGSLGSVGSERELLELPGDWPRAAARARLSPGVHYM